MSIDDLDIYLVGGAVRDTLLGLPVKEKDWVVVGATPEKMEAHGFRPVGKEFPVFLHPETHEEYALARSEKKIARGYKGFAFYSEPDVTLEEDLKRRDLTINAIAQTKTGQLIDPYHGQQDLQDKCLRHVSKAFAEDPVRILRLARFAAKLPQFTVHTETLKLMQTMVANGEVDALVPERIWKECQRALQETAPQRFFEVLNDAHALPKLFPEIKMDSAGYQIFLKATQQNQPLNICFAALCHHLSREQVQSFCRRLRIPNDLSSLATLTATLNDGFLSLDCNDTKTILQFLKQGDAQRRSDRFANLLSTLLLCHPQHKKTVEVCQKSQAAIKSIDTKSLQAAKLSPPEFAQALEELQLQSILAILNEGSSSP